MLRASVMVFLAVLAPAGVLAQESVRVVSADGRSVVHARVGDDVVLKVELRDRRGRAQPLPEGAEVRWLRVAPHMQHRDTPPPNEGVAQYSNAVLFGPQHGRWIGLDAVEYETVPLARSERVTVASDRVRLHGSPDRRDGAGTVWISASVRLPDGRLLRAPDHGDVDRLGLSSRVTRVSFRASDDFVGWLSTYFGVPSIFGSTRQQAERYVGADCADVLVATRRASGHRRVSYTSVTGIGRYATPVSAELRMSDEGTITADDGEPVALRWGNDVKPGDLLAIDYAHPNSRLPRAWDHIGALVADTDGDGVLSARDLLRHMAPIGLVDSPVGGQAPMRFRIWRWRR